MDADDGGLLGKLPRSRPGTRSGKREPERPVDSAERAARAAEERGASAARTPRTAEGPRSTVTEPERSDPVGDAVGAAAKVAGTGWRVATLVPREVLRRLPRP
jgi:hypothetical protein